MPGLAKLQTRGTKRGLEPEDLQKPGQAVLKESTKLGLEQAQNKRFGGKQAVGRHHPIKPLLQGQYLT